MPKPLERFSGWSSRLSERLARSSRVFMAGLIIACGIEVLTDWSQTLYEINVARDQVKQKGLTFASLGARVARAPLRGGDPVELDGIAKGILDDDDAVYLRVTAVGGLVVYERTDEDFEPRFAARGQGTFRDAYGHLIERDMSGTTEDPAAFQRRVASSRYRDLPQMWSDGTTHAVALLMGPKPPSKAYASVVYQDRLRDEAHGRDERTSWAVAPVEVDGARVGAVLVAFDMERVNGVIRTKYLKGLGLVVFFVGLLLVQNLMSRRDKLRLLDLETRYGGAKKSLREALPSKPVTSGELTAHGTVDQAKGPVDGMVWDARGKDGGVEVLIVDPDGDGIDAASVGLHMLRIFRQRRDAGTEVSLSDEVRALGAATEDIPLTRPIGVLLLRVAADGSFESLQNEFAALQLLTAKARNDVPATREEGETPEGLVGPLTRSQGTVPKGGILLATHAGKGGKQSHLDAAALGAFLLRLHAAGDALDVPDAATWARGKSPGLAENDIAVVAVERAVTT